jgi:hypothetical protein
MLSVRGIYENGEVKLKEKIIVEKGVPVIVTFLEEIINKEAPVKKYIFSDLAGRLEWVGDAVAQQRMLRNEW